MFFKRVNGKSHIMRLGACKSGSVKCIWEILDKIRSNGKTRSQTG